MKNGRYYIGSTKDINQRFLTHKCGGVQATKNLLPLKIVLRQKCSDLCLARKIEIKLKKLKRQDYINKIVSDGKITLLGG